jgi:hypothetical protein
MTCLLAGWLVLYDMIIGRYERTYVRAEYTHGLLLPLSGLTSRRPCNKVNIVEEVKKCITNPSISQTPINVP